MEQEVHSSSIDALDDELISAFFVYAFHKLDDVSHVAVKLLEYPFDKSKLYKTHAGQYVFVVSSEAISKDACKVVRGVLSEYGEAIHCRRSRLNHFDEHYETLIKENAIKILGTM
jgi:adapter protein MecA 1/2